LATGAEVNDPKLISSEIMRRPFKANQFLRKLLFIGFMFDRKPNFKWNMHLLGMCRDDADHGIILGRTNEEQGL
jgi:hypothetical protein